MSYIKLDRKIKEWEWFTDGNMLKLWIYLLTNAQYQDGRFRGIEVKRGQLVTGRGKLAETLKMSEQQIRTCLNRLKSTSEITINSTNKYTVITINKYSDYQDNAMEDNQQNNQQGNQRITNKQPTNNQQITTLKEIKKNKKDKNIRNINKSDIYIRHKYGEYKNVLLTDEDMEKLKAEIPNYQEYIEKVSAYCESKGKTYKNYLATIRNWYRNDHPEQKETLPVYDTSRNATMSQEEEEELLRLMKGA